MQDAGGGRSRVIDSLAAANALLAPRFAGARAERLYVAHLAADARLVGFRMRFAPAGQSIDFPVREIIADALALGSAALILAHNHPSGDATPTAADIDTTRSLVHAARPLGVAVRDHLVFGGGTFTSFRQRGLL